MISTQLLIRREQGKEEDNFKEKNLHPNVGVTYLELASSSLIGHDSKWSGYPFSTKKNGYG